MASTSSRQRAPLGFKIWHYTGSVLHKHSVAENSQLWEVCWQSFPSGAFPERPVKYQAAPSELGTTQAAPTQAYRPPALRHLPATPSSKLHEDEPPQDLRKGHSGEKSLSKSALKNQRKREAKKAAKQEAKPDPEPVSAPAPVSNSQSEASSGDPETDKKIKNLKKDAVAAELRQRYEEEQERSFEEQSVLALEDRKSALLRAMTSSGSESGGGSDEALQRRLLALEQNFTFPRSALAVQLSTARAGLSHCHESRTFLKANWPIREPDSPRREARYQVFRDLRGRGFYLTPAGKFGGDFLVYPGDPLRFHAHFIAICLTLEESICMLDVLSVARLGSNVKKTVLLCSPAPDGPVQYTSLQWSGMV